LSISPIIYCAATRHNKALIKTIITSAFIFVFGKWAYPTLSTNTN
jgi:hypothetical protein